MDYHGPDRRVHRVYLTRNTEYHVRAGICVAVRDRQNPGKNPGKNPGDHPGWTREHPAVGRRMEGSLQFRKDGIVPSPGEPAVGDAIYFRRDERDLITSRVERVDRPARDVVRSYPA